MICSGALYHVLCSPVLLLQQRYIDLTIGMYRPGWWTRTGSIFYFHSRLPIMNFKSEEGGCQAGNTQCWGQPCWTTIKIDHSCFHNKDADDGKKSNDLISLQPKRNKNSCRWLSRFSRGHLVGSDSHQPTLFLQLHEKPQLTYFEIKRNHPREPKGLKRLEAKAKSLSLWMHEWKVHVNTYC